MKRSKGMAEARHTRIIREVSEGAIVYDHDTGKWVRIIDDAPPESEDRETCPFCGSRVFWFDGVCDSLLCEDAASLDNQE